MKILVGVDGSDEARRALEWAIRVGEGLGAELLVVHAAGLLTKLDAGLPVPSQSHIAELRKLFEEKWCSPLADTAVSHRAILQEGPAVLALLEVADLDRADMIVVGRRGAGGAQEALIGSTSHQLAERSHVPVVIVPPPLS